MLVFFGTVLGMVLAALDQTIVATALPAIVADLHGFERLSWVVTANLLASTITVPLYGKLSDLFGRKRVFVFAIVLFLIGSVLSGLSQTMTQLIIFRGVQGLGAGGVIPLAQAIIGEIFSPRERFRYQGYTGTLFAASSIVGPLLGGYLTDAVSWRAVFYINVPLGAIALTVIVTTMKIPFEPRERPIDVLGAMLLSGWVSLCLLVAVWSGSATQADAPRLIVAAIAAVALFVAFVAVELRAAEPILPLRLFRNSIFTVANAAAAVIGACRFTVTIYIPVFMQGVIGTTATRSGVMLIPFMLAWIASGIAAGQTVTRTGRYRIWPISGSITTLIGFFALAGLNVHSSREYAALCMILLGAGMGQMFQTYVVAMQNAVPRSSLGIATASVQFSRTIGSMFGAAVFGSLLTRQLGSELTARLGDGAREVSPGALLAGTMRVADVSPGAIEAVRSSLASALHTAFLGGIPLMGLGLIAAFMLKELPLRTKSHVEEASERATGAAPGDVAPEKT